MKKKSIIVVDDDVEFTGMAKLLLERTGLFEVGICTTGAMPLR